MRVTFFIGSLYGGGAERVTCSLASYLVGRGHQAEILTMSETKDTYELDKRVTTKTLLPINNRRNKTWNTMIRLLRFWKYLMKTKTDVYIVMLPKTTIMFLAFRWMTKAKVIASERVDPASYSKLIGGLLKKLARRADGFVFQTKEAKDWYGKAIKDCKAAVIPNAINPIFIRESYNGLKRKAIVGAGRLRDQKNFALLIHAFANIAEEFPEYDLIIYGEGEKRGELERLIRELGLEGRASLPGNVRNIADEMEKNTLFVLSSNYEGMPNALMEAMALGLPCISTDCPCGGPRFLIKDGENGVLIPVGSEKELSASLKKMLGNPQFCNKLGNAAKTIQERLKPDLVYGEWEHFLMSICDQKE